MTLLMDLLLPWNAKVNDMTYLAHCTVTHLSGTELKRCELCVHNYFSGFLYLNLINFQYVCFFLSFFSPLSRMCKWSF